MLGYIVGYERVRTANRVLINSLRLPLTFTQNFFGISHYIY